MEFSVNDLLSSLSKTNGSSDGKDIGSFLKQEVEEAISPVTDRVERLEKKLDLLILSMERVEKLLTSIKPLLNIINNFPFLKK